MFFKEKTFICEMHVRAYLIRAQKDYQHLLGNLLNEMFKNWSIRFFLWGELIRNASSGFITSGKLDLDQQKPLWKTHWSSSDCRNDFSHPIGRQCANFQTSGSSETPKSSHLLIAGSDMPTSAKASYYRCMRSQARSIDFRSGQFGQTVILHREY